AAMPDPSASIWSWAGRTLARTAWAPIAVVVIDFVAGMKFGAYLRFPNFDFPMHLLGGAAIAYVFHTASTLGSRNNWLAAYHRLPPVALVFGWVTVTAVFWEFFEYLVDHALHTRMGGDVDDTLGDLAMGLTGGATFLLVAWLCGKLPPGQPDR